jgi:hypothetical protein
MEKENLLLKIKQFNWSIFNGPIYYKPLNVPKYLTMLVRLNNEDQNIITYNNILSSIGNNHSGTFYKVAEEAINYILIIACESENEIARNCALNILTDLYGSFEASPESYCNTQESINGKIFIKEKILSTLHSAHVIITTDESDRNKSLIMDILTQQ